MTKHRKTSLLILAVVLLGFAAGIVQLFQLRFQAGDVYPEYSSLRADPLGSRAFFESLDELLPARRNYRPFSKLGAGKQTTLFYLGADLEDLQLLPSEIKDLEDFLTTGGRLVISLYPRYQKITRWPGGAFPATTNAPTGPGKPKSVKGKRVPSGDEFKAMRPVPLTTQWGFQLDYLSVSKNDRQVYEAVTADRQDDSSLPESITCHTAMVFNKLDPAWKVVYARSTNGAVLIERKLGQGSIIVSADSYYVSNEALLKDRQPALLAWFVGANQSVIFDEQHLGVQEAVGIATLARKYRLHGFVAGLLLLAVLYAWKNSTSLVPAPGWDDAAAEHMTGRESAAGFINLLRRNIKSRELLGVCISEWQKSCARQFPRNKLEQIQLVIDQENNLPPNEHDPVRTYHAIHRILTERKLNYDRKS